jgi:hypothetical protein
MQVYPCNERSSILYIKKEVLPKNIYKNNQYELKQNMFDPTKSSPPNEFMEKLRLRMSVYDSFNKNLASLTNE